MQPVSKRNTRHSVPLSRQPLLVIDGDSFAHRSYHALPKTILPGGRKPAGAITGFANMLLRFYRDKQPRAVFVAWDTLEAPLIGTRNFQLTKAAENQPGTKQSHSLKSES